MSHLSPRHNQCIHIMCKRWLHLCHVLCVSLGGAWVWILVVSLLCALGGRCETLAVSQLCSLSWSLRYMCERWLYPCCVFCLSLEGTCVNVGCIPVMFSV